MFKCGDGISSWVQKEEMMGESEMRQRVETRIALFIDS